MIWRDLPEGGGILAVLNGSGAALELHLMPDTDGFMAAWMLPSGLLLTVLTSGLA